MFPSFRHMVTHIWIMPTGKTFPLWRSKCLVPLICGFKNIKHNKWSAWWLGLFLPFPQRQVNHHCPRLNPSINPCPVRLCASESPAAASGCANTNQFMPNPPQSLLCCRLQGQRATCTQLALHIALLHPPVPSSLSFGELEQPYWTQLPLRNTLV